MENYGWQEVCHRHKTRATPSRSEPQLPLKTYPLNLLGSRPTYAQALAGTTPLATASAQTTNLAQATMATSTVPLSSNNPPPPTRPRNNPPGQQVHSLPHPARPRQPMLITSPDSSITLRFLPTLGDPDWTNRCFRCFRKGHTAPKCVNESRCAFCWGEGHEYKDCRQPIAHPR